MELGRCIKKVLAMRFGNKMGKTLADYVYGSTWRRNTIGEEGGM